MSAVPAAQTHLSITTRRPDPEISQLREIISDILLVEDRCDLDAQLGTLLAGPRTAQPRTLDLIGHTVPDTALLQLGDWIIDARNATVTAFFRELAEQEVFERLNVRALRLLGSRSAETEQGRATICRLAEILGVEVFGAVGPVYVASFGEHGLRDNAPIKLCSSVDLHAPSGFRPAGGSTRHTLNLDIDSLPATRCGSVPWPRYIVAEHVAREILALVHRDSGEVMPALLATPDCELAFPAVEPASYHLVHVLLDHELVRVYPNGIDRPAIGYSVRDRVALRAMLANLINDGQ